MYRRYVSAQLYHILAIPNRGLEPTANANDVITVPSSSSRQIDKPL